MASNSTFLGHCEDLDWEHEYIVPSDKDFTAEKVDFEYVLSALRDQRIVIGRIITEASAVAVEQAHSATLEQRFGEEAGKWWNETAHFSSPAQQMMHPSYQAILGMGATAPLEVAGLMIRDMQKNRRPWFMALSYLTHANPIKSSDAGKIDRMIKAWVEWGKAQHLI